MCECVVVVVLNKLFYLCVCDTFTHVMFNDK